MDNSLEANKLPHNTHSRKTAREKGMVAKRKGCWLLRLSEKWFIGHIVQKLTNHHHDRKRQLLPSTGGPALPYQGM